MIAGKLRTVAERMATNAWSSTSSFFVGYSERNGIVGCSERNGIVGCSERNGIVGCSERNGIGGCSERAGIIVSYWIDGRIVGTFRLNAQHQVIQVTIDRFNRFSVAE